MEKLNEAGTDSIFVRQKKEWGEILTGFETKNKYAVFNNLNQQIYWAAEQSSFLARIFLKNWRPLTIHILSVAGHSVLKNTRPFKFYFHEMHISDSNGQHLGTIKRKFSVFTRKFIIEDNQGIELFKIHGPFFHPWTFNILKNDIEVGKILKKWSGMGKEIFTDADNFNITFPVGIDAKQKAVFLGALFLIDLLYFEK
ncbi:MAG: scramblase [Elusimicrobia bacterium]|nr:scramblase [Elusimicrobiota bacterium]